MDVDLSKRESDSSKELARMKKFLTDARSLLDNDKMKFKRYYALALKVWMQEMMQTDAGDVEIQRDMSIHSRRANFTNMLRTLALEADLAKVFWEDKK